MGAGYKMYNWRTGVSCHSGYCF